MSGAFDEGAIDETDTLNTGRVVETKTNCLEEAVKRTCEHGSRHKMYPSLRRYVKALVSDNRPGQAGLSVPHWLVGNTVREQLEVIVYSSRVAPLAHVDKVPDKIRGFSIRLFKDKAFAEVLHRCWFEARQSRIKHRQYNVRQLVNILPRSQESFDAEFFESSKRLGTGRAAHDCHHLGREFERRTFEFDSSWSYIKAKAEIDVQNVSSVVDHDISIVSILELEEE